MKINQIHFSPTGGTKKLLDIFSDSWEGEKEYIDISISERDYSIYNFEKDELCFIALPSFGGRVPNVTLEHLSKIKGRATPAVLIVSFGNRHYDDTLLELKEIVSQNGFHVIAAIAGVTEHSIMNQFGAGRPDKDDKKILSTYADRIQELFEKDLLSEDIKVKGNKPYREYNGLALKPKTSRACIKCGICAEQCPTNAIPKENPSETNENICITCMRCIKICPENARKLNQVKLLFAGKKMEKSCLSRKENELFLAYLD